MHAPYSVLLQVGFTMPLTSRLARCALTAPFHPYHRPSAGGLLSVALSLSLRWAGVTRHHFSMEPGLSSSTRHARASGCPTVW